MKNTIGFVGAGNMGGALIRCFVQGGYSVWAFDVSEAAMQGAEEAGARRGTMEDVLQCNYIVLAVKPQILPTVLEQIKGKVSETQIIISIAAGVTIRDLKQQLGSPVRVVRVMPNTPAAIGMGMSSVVLSETEFSAEEQQKILEILQLSGKVAVIKETLMDAAMAVAGCSPAYVCMFIEALADAGVAQGLPRQVAYTMAAQAVAGSASLVLESGKLPAELKDQVCSPGGTTIEGVKILEERAFRGTVMQAVQASAEKAARL